jgi:ADP-ribose pyrophosphatase YjhB (NUDIX family)
MENLRHIKRTIVSALLISSDNKIFMGKKDPKEGGVYAECWHIPGGGVEEGESLVEALIREIKEETGVDISNEQINCVDNKGFGEATKILPSGEKVIVEMKFIVFEIK